MHLITYIIYVYVFIEKLELARRSQVIQRNLPRPLEANMLILRPPSDSGNLTELQQAEELIKREMITMLHYDAVNNPVQGKYC